MQKWYENTTLLNTFIVFMVVCVLSYFFYQWQMGLYLFLLSGTVIMVRGVTKITIRMRSRKNKQN